MTKESTVIPGVGGRDGFPKEVTRELKWKDEKLGLRGLQHWNQARHLLGTGTSWLSGSCGVQKSPYLTVLNTLRGGAGLTVFSLCLAQGLVLSGFGW